LAFLFRTFEAEAFVIPTGSMAPTLLGRNKDYDCPKCGFEYQINAHDEVYDDGGSKGPEYQIVAGTCPICRYADRDLADKPAYSGDRILVSKLAYGLAEPQRWDVIVFKFPGEATTNFIKRLVGLPGETVRIQHGDLWIQQGSGEFNIARKPPDKLLAMLQPVFDNDLMPRIAKDGWPARWTADKTSDGAWKSDDWATFQTDGTAQGERWLRYHHLVPSFRDWQVMQREGSTASLDLQPQLITDFTAYNTARTRGVNNPSPELDSLGFYWVGDLALSCTTNVESDKGELLFELRKGGRKFHCRMDVATGQATLSVSGHDMESFKPTATTAVRGTGRHDIRFSNCDNEMRLWVDGKVVAFDRPTAYADLKNTMPDASDYQPVGVATIGAKAKLNHLAIVRDLYYIGDLSYAEPQRFTGQPLGFSSVAHGADARLKNETERTIQFSLKADQFFVLGDNSARSKDGRLWEPDSYWVPRDLLIGKALYIYWPHSWDKIPLVNIPCPFFPNFARMKLVR
jgi:signal peptidase I